MSDKVFYGGYSNTEGKKPRYNQMPVKQPTAGKASGETHLRTHPARNRLTAESQRRPFGAVPKGDKGNPKGRG